ncbi:uncharacterized protein V6R79_020147 [Siganus canaliculatus]
MTRKQRAGSHEKTKKNEKQNIHTQTTTTHSQISSCLCPHLATSKLDPDLDGRPSTRPSAPAPYSASYPSEARGAAQPDMPTAPKSCTTNSPSPDTHRLHHHTQHAPLSTPMAQVSGPEDPTLGFRIWTYADITVASQHLPNLTTPGRIFAEELLIFCREFKPTINELRRLLIPKIKLRDWATISNKFPATDLCCKHINWKDAANVQYRDAIHYLCDSITQAFPVQVNMARVTACTQRDGENPDEYLTRLTEAYNTHSGLQLPDELGNAADFASGEEGETFHTAAGVRGPTANGSKC